MPPSEVVIDDKVPSADDVFDELNKDTEPEIIDKEEPEVEEVESEDDESEGEVEKEPEVKIEDTKDDEYEDLPKRQLILKEFPELFKKFPQIEKAMYREQEYARVFPTISDAKEANERLQDFSKFEGELLNGNLESTLISVKNANKESFSKITSELLQTLEKVDKDAYLGTLSHVVKNTIFSAYDFAKKNGDEQLEIAAQLLNKFIFQTTNVTPSRIEPKRELTDQEKQLSVRESAFAKQQLETAVDSVSTRVESAIKSAVEKSLDPKGLMTPYVKNKAMDDILSQARTEILNEPRFRALYDKMWLGAAKENYNSDSRDRIRKALINRAQSVLPDIIRRVKADALKGQTTRLVNKKTDDEPEEQGSRVPTKRNTSVKEPKRGMSTLDFLNQD